jgi:hypothetical protein
MVVSNCVLRIFIFKPFNRIFIFDLEFGSELCPKIQDGHGVMLKLYRTALPTRVAVLLPSATNVSKYRLVGFGRNILDSGDGLST